MISTYAISDWISYLSKQILYIVYKILLMHIYSYIYPRQLIKRNTNTASVTDGGSQLILALKIPWIRCCLCMTTMMMMIVQLVLLQYWASWWQPGLAWKQNYACHIVIYTILMAFCFTTCILCCTCCLIAQRKLYNCKIKLWMWLSFLVIINRGHVDGEHVEVGIWEYKEYVLYIMHVLRSSFTYI